jgi:hypothetical protein
MNRKLWKKSDAVSVEAAGVKYAQLVVGLRGGTQFTHTSDRLVSENPFKEVGDWYESESPRYFTFEWSSGGFFTLDRDDILYMYTKEEK